MSWDKFKALLSGIGPKTALGRIVEIRSQDDEKMLEYYSEEQHKIRVEWKEKQKKAKAEFDKRKGRKRVNQDKDSLNKLSEMFKNMFS